MKRILAMAVMICLVLSLAGCGGSPASELGKENEKAAEQSVEPAAADDSDFSQWGTQEFSVETGIGEDGGKVDVKTGSDIVWDSEKMGGLPMPEGVTVVMEMDMSEVLGQEIAYNYSVTGLTKEGFEEYIKLVSDTFPKVLENTLSDTEGTFVASTEDLGKRFHVSFIEGSLSIIQYME